MARKDASDRMDQLLQKRRKTVEAEEDDETADVDVETLEESEADDSSEHSGEVATNYEPKTFHVHPYKPYDKLAVEYFNGHGREHKFEVSKEAEELVESGKKGFHGMRRGGQFPLQKFLEWLNGGVSQMVRGYVGGGGKGEEEVAAVILFGTLSFDQLLATEYEAKYKDQFSEAMKLIWGVVPADVPIITCFGSGVIANVPWEDPHRGILQRSLELESDKLPFLAGMVIPKVDGLGIKRFVVTEKQCDNLRKGQDADPITISMKNCRELLGITRQNEKDLKGIVFFHGYVDKWTDNYNYSPAVIALHTYLESCPHVAMAGGIYPTLLSSGTADEDVIACGFLIFGKDNQVRVSCAALTEPEMSIGNKHKLNKFKTTLMVAEDEEEEVSSFALMFGCNERGICMHGKPNVESDFFNQIFPKTKLVGGFDLGEFYREILVHYPKLVTLPPPAQIHRVHVSVFLLVSYRHPKV